MARYASRKFLVTMIFFGTVAGMRLLDALSDDATSSIMSIIILAYMGGNVGAKFTAKPETSVGRE